jgi:hypothetical protein
MEGTLRWDVGLVVQPDTQLLVDLGHRFGVRNGIEHSNDADVEDLFVRITDEEGGRDVRWITS